jgi:hypothetical protein
MARRPLFSAVLWFNKTVCAEREDVSIFLVDQVVLVQNSSQSSPLSQMKLVISQKAWYVTTCWSGIIDVGNRVGAVNDVIVMGMKESFGGFCCFVISQW